MISPLCLVARREHFCCLTWVPLGTSFRFVSLWDRVKERFHKKLALRKRPHLSRMRELLYSRAHYLACLSILCLCFVIQEQIG